MPKNDRIAVDRRVFLRDMALILGLPLGIVIALLAWWQPSGPDYEVEAGADVFAVAAGTWDWAGAEGFCKKNPHTLSFSRDRSVMVYTQSEPWTESWKPWTDKAGQEHRVAEYDIQGHTKSRIRGRIRGELRMTNDREPVVWDLVLTSRDSYRWHRTDWSPGATTGEIRRCGRSGGA